MDSAIVASPQALGGLQLNEQGMVDLGAMRPWIGRDGVPYVNVNGQAMAVPNVNALLQKDEWIAYDNAVRSVGVIRLNGIADLMNAGLTWNAGDIGTTIAEWDEVSDMTAAEANMSGVAKTEKDTPAFDLNGVPIPIIRKDFSVNARRLIASRRNGQGVDVIGARTASRLVAEKSEDMLFNGIAITAGSYTIYGYTNQPQRNTGNVSDWSAGATTGADIIDDINTMIAALEADYHYGPYNLYVPGNFWPKLREDYSANKGDNTIMDRIMALPQIQSVKVSDQLADDNVVLVQMDGETVDLAIAQGLTTVQWERGDGMQTNFAVMAAWVPRLRPDYNGRIGIAHYSV